MENKSCYYKKINLIRLISCIAVLFYHFNFLKGGFLAVCIFFVLSGYLSCISAFRKEKFSLLSYYRNRLKKIYLPLIIVVFMTIGILSFISPELWLNLKVETKSVLLGYNNFWQISANSDYFARHINSPFIHFWYIGILLQFELFFPFIYIIFSKIGKNFNKHLPCILIITESILFTLYFFFMSRNTSNIMILYYDTFCRLFSLLIGVSLGFIHTYYKVLVSKKLNSLQTNIIFVLYLILLIFMFVFIDSGSKWFVISMILVSIISCRLIDYAVSSSDNRLTIFDKFINSLSKISYEIYLVQYPVIYIFQDLKINNILKLFIMIGIIVIISYILNFSLNYKKKEKNKWLKISLLVIIILISLYGGFKYIISEDHTKEMKALEQQLQDNKTIFEQKKKEYESQFRENEKNWAETLTNLENGKNELENVVKNLSIVGVGDSIMLGAIDKLYEHFPNSYLDAKISRTCWQANGILQNIKNRNILGDVVLINLGANGDCPEHVKASIMNTIGDRKVFWVNVTNDSSVNVNNKLLSFAKKYQNLHIVDWNASSMEHPEYFISDGIHLTAAGKIAYTETIYKAIYDVYLNEYEKEKQKIIDQHDDEQKNKITFYGDKILLNLFNDLHENYINSNYVIEEDFSYKFLKNTIEDEIDNNSLTNKIVFMLDNNFNIKKEEYESLINLCGNKQIYFVATNEKQIKSLSSLKRENVLVINFYNKIKNSDNYLSIDGVNLSEFGSKALFDMINNELNK